MSKLYQIKIQLEEITPPIWRRVIVPSDISLSEFHKVIQKAMGWTNSHLHQFIKKETFYLPRMKEDPTWEDSNKVDYKRWKVSGLLRKVNDEIIYEYDFGNSWKHTILLEKITDNRKDRRRSKCRAGERNCPPEECRGPNGYKELLRVISDPDHEEYENYISRLRGGFDPEYFSVQEANILLRRKDFGPWCFW